jgi:tetratricopeptide (TPR) repeat protein
MVLFRKLCCPLFFVALLAAGLPAGAAWAQTPDAGLVPYIDLDATLSTDDAQAADSMQFDPQVACTSVHMTTAKLFDDAPPKEGGWKGLANLLEALTPDVDTDIPLTPSQITARITTMLNQGQNQAALNVIEKLDAQQQDSHEAGTDVQLLFLHARALAALDRHNEAIGIYQRMTTLYPELPEPWNNLASEYVKQDKLEMAHDALQMALTANPLYPAAKANMGRVELMLASESFKSAAQLGVSGADAKARQAQAALQP